MMNAIGRFAFGRPVAETRPTERVAARPATALAGRVLISFIFILSGIDKFAAWDASVAYAQNQGLPAAPFFIGAAAVVEIAGGLAILAGTATRIGALLLFLYLIPVTLTFHNFWALQGAEAQLQMVQFLKNLTIMGGLLLLVAGGAGRYSADETIGKRQLRRGEAERHAAPA